jgi:CBS domain-containing protein
MRIEKLMSSPIYSIKPDASLASAIELMRKYDIGRISVVDEGKLVGIVDRNDLIKGYLG